MQWVIRKRSLLTVHEKHQRTWKKKNNNNSRPTKTVENNIPLSIIIIFHVPERRAQMLCSFLDPMWLYHSIRMMHRRPSPFSIRSKALLISANGTSWVMNFSNSSSCRYTDTLGICTNDQDILPMLTMKILWTVHNPRKLPCSCTFQLQMEGLNEVCSFQRNYL